MQVGVLGEFYISHRCLDSPNDEFPPVDSVIDVNFDLPVEHSLTMNRSLKFGVDEYLMIDSTKVRYIAKEFKVDDTRIQVTMNRSIPLNLFYTSVVLLFL